MTSIGSRVTPSYKSHELSLSPSSPSALSDILIATMEFMSALGSQDDVFRPSLFELIAQEKLREMLQPAVKYILAVR